jgi:CRP/FNR family transcriptional regulator, cyclic AMP receptor protein
MTDLNEPRRGFWGELWMTERAALQAGGSWGEFLPGAIMFAQDDTTDHVAIIWSGYTKVVTGTDAGREVVLALRGPGDVVGEMVSIGGGRRSATVTAIDRVEALLIDASRFVAFLSDSPHASSILTQILVGRLREADQHRLAAGSMTVGQRLARLLLDLANSYGVPARGGGTRIALALSQRDLAAWVGGSHRTVAREMEKWRERGIVTTGRRSVIVQQKDALRRISGLREPPDTTPNGRTS